MKSIGLTAVAFGHLLSWCCLAVAQQAGGESAQGGGVAGKAVQASKPSGAEEVRPWVFYLPDQKGQLQPVIDFSYQDFVSLYKLKNHLERREEPPRYTLQRITATGTAKKEYAELEIQFQVLVRDEAWVRVPLRFDQGVLRGKVGYEGEGEQFIEYESNGDGYVCWLRGKPGSQHTLTANMLAPLTAAGDQTRLKIFVPKATASELKLRVPLANAISKASESATLLPSASEEGATVFNVAGLGGEFMLAWFAAGPDVVEAPLALEASGAILTRLDSRSIVAEATLSVRSYGAAFDRFVVRLPSGAELSPAVGGGATITPIAPEKKDQGLQRQVLVQLPKKTAGPVEVRLACHRSYDPAKDQSWCELAGFEVVDAVRQWGTLAVAVAGDWQVLWGTSSNLRETDQLPDVLRKDDLVAAYEYSSQPYSLTARLMPRKTRIGVDPKYLLQMDRDVVRLTGKLGYTIRGAKVSTLDIAIPGWELDEVGPESMVAVDGVTLNGSNLAVPLSQPMSGTVELQLRAHRSMDLKGKSFTAALPRPRANRSGPVSLTVLAADNMELTPRAGEMAGLTRQSVAPSQEENLPERQQDPLYYRGTGDHAVFAADFQIHSQRVTVDVVSEATLRHRAVEVEQRQVYTIAYEPLDHFTIAVPRILAAAKRVQAFCEGKPLELIPESRRSRDEDATLPVPMRVLLPRPRIGSCVLTLRYSVPIADAQPNRTMEFALPLPMPEVGQITANRVMVQATRNTKASLRAGSEWTAVEPDLAAAENTSGLYVVATKCLPKVEMEFRREADDADATIVDRAWVQTWFNSTERQDRAAFQLTTDRKEIEVQLPAGASASQAIVLVNGKRTEYRRVSEDRCVAPLPRTRESRHYVVELLYRFSENRPPIGSLQVQFPRIGRSVWIRRMYWQLVLPANEHVITHPEGFTGEFSWDWRGYYFGRGPLLDQGELESWVGATSRSPLSERANVYLFSTIGNADRVTMYTAVRAWVVLVASGASLVLGLLLIYVPATRRAGSLLVMSVVLLAVGMVAPEPTLLFAQAAILGLVLTLVSGIMERSVTRHRRTVIRKDSSNSRIELEAIPTPYRSPLVTDPASTEALVPVVDPPSQGNSRS